MAKSLIQLVADNVRAARQSKEWSRAELSRKSGVAENTVRHIEEPASRAPNARGSASPRMDMLDKLASAMGYPTWQLLTENFDPVDRLAERPITAKEQQLHDQIITAYRQLDRSQFDGNDRT